MNSVGVQTNGGSPHFVQKLALRAVSQIGRSRFHRVVDVGGGRGEVSIEFSKFCDRVDLIDFSPPKAEDLPANVIPTQANFNDNWPLEDCAFDFSFSTEVIEHVENPRHFFREMKRITKPGGHVFVTTPNNHSVSSKVTFLLKGQHRFFQDASYPAHISPLLLCDFIRIAEEVQIDLVGLLWSGGDTIPRIRLRLPFGGKLFSASVGVLFKIPD